jgi:hypothetical protein
MPRYFFSIRDSLGLIPDEEGSDFSSPEAALAEAEATARDLAKQLIDMKRPLSAVVEVRDVKGALIASIPLAKAIMPRQGGTLGG